MSSHGRSRVETMPTGAVGGGGRGSRCRDRSSYGGRRNRRCTRRSWPRCRLRRAELERGCVAARACEGVAATLTTEVPESRPARGKQRKEPWPQREEIFLRSRIGVDDRRRGGLSQRVGRKTCGLAGSRCGGGEVEARAGRRCYTRPRVGRGLESGSGRPLCPCGDATSRVGGWLRRLCRCSGGALRRRLRRSRLRCFGPASDRSVDREVAKLRGSDSVLGSRRRRRDGDRRTVRRTLVLCQGRRSDTHRERNGRRTYAQS